MRISWQADKIVLGEVVNALVELRSQLILPLLLLQTMHKSKGQLRQPARLAVDSVRLAMAQLARQGLRSQSHYPNVILRSVVYCALVAIDASLRSVVPHPGLTLPVPCASKDRAGLQNA